MWTMADSDRRSARRGARRLRYLAAGACLLLGQALAQVPPQSVLLTAVPTSAHVGEAVVLTAQNNHVPYYTGLEMWFFEDGAAVPSCSPVVLNPTGNSATCTVTSATYGTRQYSASLGSPTGGPAMAVSNVVPVAFDKWVADVILGMDVPDPALGQMVTFTAQVSGQLPTGDVSFHDAFGANPAAPLCTSTLLPGISSPPSATCATVIIRSGPHRISAHYLGDANHWDGWSGDLDFIVGSLQTQSVTTVDVAPPVPVAGEPAVLTATVSGLAPTGSVTILDGTATVCVATLDAVPADSQSVVCDWVFDAAGPHAISANYGGDGDNLPSSASLTVQVDAAPVVPVSVHLLLLPADAQAGQHAVLRAEVTGEADGATVTFLDGGEDVPGCAQVSVSAHAGGAATADCALVLSSRGQHAFSAIYRRGGLVREGAAQRLVPGRSTATSLARVGGAAWAGQPVVLQATVSGESVRGGSVRFRDGATAIPGCDGVALAPQAVQRMMADCVTTFPAAGRHALVAEYSGDRYSATSSGALALVVDATAPALLLTVLDLPFVDQPVLVRATLNGLPPGGTVAFGKDGQAITGCEAVMQADPSGAPSFAECSTAFAEAGPHTLQAIYTFASGRETAEIDIEVEANPTATRLRVEPPPGGAREGERVWLHADVLPATAAGGRVAFGGDATAFDGCQASVLAAGNDGVAVARCEAILGQSGVRSLQASFQADRTHAASADRLSITVAPASAVLSLSLPDGAVVGEPARLEARASGASSGGRVAFSDAGLAIPGCQALPLDGTSGAAVAQCITRFPLAGLRLVGAEHDAGSSRPQAALTIDVAKAASSTRLTAAPTPSGTALMLQARVLGYFPAGTVAFHNEGAPIPGCEAVALETASPQEANAACTLTGSAPRWVSATYPGDGNNAPSEAIRAVAGVVAATLDLVRVDQGPAYADRVLNLEARVSGTSPTGSVSFFDGPGAIPGCAAVPLAAAGSGALARCDARLAGARAHALRAEYPGDLVHTPAAGTLALAVERNPTVTQLEVVGARFTGASLRLRATVSGHAPGGQVAFLADGVEIAGCDAVAVAATPPDVDIGQAECVTTFAQPGTRDLEARYGGDAANAASSRVLTQVAVLQAPEASGATRVQFFGQQALRFTLHNPGTAPVAEVRVSFDAARVARIAFLPACSTSVGSGGGAVSCENPVALEISCGEEAGTRFCGVASLAPGASLSFVAFPSGSATAPLQVVVSVAGAVVSRTVLDPDR